MNETTNSQESSTMTTDAIDTVLAAQPIGLTAGGLSGYWATIRKTLATSAACHPDWDAETHVGYLIWDEGIPAGIIRTMLGIPEREAIERMITAARNEVRIGVAGA